MHTIRNGVLKCKHQISAADYNPAMKFEQILKCQRNFNRSALYWLLTILVDDIAARSAINNNLRLTITEKIRQSIQRVFLHRCNQSNTVYIRLTYTGLLLQHSPTKYANIIRKGDSHPLIPIIQDQAIHPPPEEKL